MNNIKTIRRGTRMNQSQFAELLNVSQQTISNWENDVTDIDIESLKKISDRFKVSIDYILGKTDLPVELGRLNWDDNVRPVDLYSEVDFGKVPILGSIAAGTPREAVINGDYEDYVYADTREYGDKLVFGLNVKGNSMEPRIYEGDIAIVEACSFVNSGTVAAVRVNGGETTLKKIKFESNGMWLIGFNPAFKPIFYTAEECEKLPVTVIGRLVQVIQNY